MTLEQVQAEIDHARRRCKPIPQGKRRATRGRVVGKAWLSLSALLNLEFPVAAHTYMLLKYDPRASCGQVLLIRYRAKWGEGGFYEVED